MYWCKRLIEWTPDARTALKWAIYLNNKFQLDGRDENGYMGIAWCFGQHDRPFPERPIFGSVRSMSPSGLESKFDMAKYERIVRAACQQERRPQVRALLPRRALTGNQSILAFFGGGTSGGGRRQAGAGRGLAGAEREWRGKLPLSAGQEGERDGREQPPACKRARS